MHSCRWLQNFRSQYFPSSRYHVNGGSGFLRSVKIYYHKVSYLRRLEFKFFLAWIYIRIKKVLFSTQLPEILEQSRHFHSCFPDLSPACYFWRHLQHLQHKMLLILSNSSVFNYPAVWRYIIFSTHDVNIDLKLNAQLQWKKEHTKKEEFFTS